MTAPVTLALPSKGRLEDAARAAFAAAGLPVTRPGGARAYLGAIDGLPDVTVRFLSAGEIARELVRGGIDAGVTGADLIHEAAEDGAESVIFAHGFDFGHADVVVAVPDPWIDVTSMRDLSDVASDFRARHRRWLRVATKYLNLTRRHFAAAGIAEYRIVESLGATEAAPASGAADLIVDITTTGATLKANGLRILEDGLILKSTASLVVARGATADPARREILGRLLAPLGAAMA